MLRRQEPKPWFWNKACISSDSVIFQNQRFKIVFDLPTPRPHFIIRYVADSNEKMSISDMNRTDLESMLALVDRFVAEFNLSSKPDDSELILSFHTGDWVRVTILFLLKTLSQLKYLIWLKKTSKRDFLKNSFVLFFVTLIFTKRQQPPAFMRIWSRT